MPLRGRARRSKLPVDGRRALVVAASLTALWSGPALARAETGVSLRVMRTDRGAAEPGTTADEATEPEPTAAAPEASVHGEATGADAPEASSHGEATGADAPEASTHGEATGAYAPEAGADGEAVEPDASADPKVGGRPRVTEDPDPAADEPTSDETLDEEPAAPVEDIRPPRIDGVYVGGFVFSGLGLLRVNDFDTAGPFASFGGTVTVGQMVFPWLGLGLHGGGGGGVRSESGARQTLGQGYLGVDFRFVPAPKHLPLSLRASFGFGGGAVRQEGIADRSGFGGAQFSAGVRYEWFPWAKRKRPYRGGGFGLGPELGWIGFTPAAAGRPMSNVIYLAISTTFYFGS